MPDEHPLDLALLSDYRLLFGPDRWSFHDGASQIVGLNAQLTRGATAPSTESRATSHHASAVTTEGHGRQGRTPRPSPVRSRAHHRREGSAQGRRAGRPRTLEGAASSGGGAVAGGRQPPSTRCAAASGSIWHVPEGKRPAEEPPANYDPWRGLVAPAPRVARAEYALQLVGGVASS